MKFSYFDGFIKQTSKSSRVFWATVATIVLSLGVAGPVFATASTPKPKRIVVGAKLNEYKKPAKSKCDINVPSQFKTIQAGIDAAVDGNTVCVSAGTYNENVNINKSIRLSGSGASQSIINGQTTDAAVYIAGDGNANNVVVEGFLVNGADSDDVNRNDPTTFNIGPFTSGAIVRYNRIVAGNATLAVRADSGQNNEQIYSNILEGNNSPTLFKVSGVQGPSYKVDFFSNSFVGTVNSTIPNQSGSGTVLDTWATDSLIQQNAFNTNGSISTLISSAYSSNIVTENNLNSISTVKVGTYSGGTLNAENNWWGDTDPSDNIQGNIDFTPFALRQYPEN